MRDDLKELATRLAMLEALYEAVDELMAHREMTMRGPQVDKVLNALYDIDGGSRF